MTLMRFLHLQYGQRIKSPNGLGGQCVDLVELYCTAVLGVPEVPGNAIAFAGKKLPGFSWVANTRWNAPRQGDIPVWGPSPTIGTGAAGHVAIALIADGESLLTLDQNWPKGSPVAVVHHAGYDGVLGWQTPHRGRTAP